MASIPDSRDDAMLYKKLATLRLDVPLVEKLDDLRWRGARKDELEALCGELGYDRFLERVERFQ